MTLVSERPGFGDARHRNPVCPGKQKSIWVSHNSHGDVEKSPQQSKMVDVNGHKWLMFNSAQMRQRVRPESL